MNLLLVDKSLKSLETFLNGCNSTTKCVVYEVTDSFDDIRNKISELGEVSFSNLGFVFENNQSPLILFVSNNPYLSFDENGVKENNVSEFIKELVDMYSIETVDFLACDLLLDDKWRSYFELLQNQSSDKNLIVRASNNKSGNLQHGGDWVLETTNEDVTSLYFNDSIGQWGELLGFAGTYFNNAILLDESYNNIYTSGISYDNNNRISLLRYNGEYINSEYIFNKNIIYIESSASCFAFLTDETSNNLYVIGYNESNKFGISGHKHVITNVTTNILNKKVNQVCFSKEPSVTRVMYILTDESINNLYSCGSDPKILGLGTTTSTSTLQRITYLNQKVNKILCNDNSRCELITEEPSNNIFYINNTLQGNFVRLNDLILYNKKIIDGDCNFFFRYKITDESSNNLYVIGGNGSYPNRLGLGEGINTVSSYTKISDYSTSLSNKKVEKVYIGTPYYDWAILNGPFVLTNESSNNLYACGNNTQVYTLGIGNNSISTYVNVSNYSTQLLNKKIIEVSSISTNQNNRCVSLITNESSNNLYSCGFITYVFGEALIGLYNNSNLNSISYTFKNVSLSPFSEIFNKKVKLIKSYSIPTQHDLSILITDELSTSLNSNIYITGNETQSGTDEYAWGINRTSKYYKKMKYPLLNKKYIKINRTDTDLFTITNESSNNLYYTFPVAKGNILSNLSNIIPLLQNKKVIDIDTGSSSNVCFFLTNETSNNLYYKQSVNVTKFTTNILNKKINKISTSAWGNYGLLTDEPYNNYYGKGNGLTLGNGNNNTLSNFTNITYGILNNKKFTYVELSNNRATYLVSNESSNNLYACGEYYLGDGVSDYSSRILNYFINITLGISGKKVEKVFASDKYVAVLTDEDPSKRYFDIIPTDSIYLNSINSYSTIKSSAYSSTLNRIVGLCKNGGIVYSDNAGTTWNSYTNISNMYYGNNIIWVAEKQEFYIIGNANYVVKSSNGINWTSITTINSDSDYNSSTIDWSPELGLFCTTKGNSLTNIVYSSNCINWQTAINPTPGVSKYGVTWIKELNRFYAISASALEKCLVYSSNGVNWTKGGVISNINSEFLKTIAWSKELNKLCVILTKSLPSSAHDVYSYTSSDSGLTWTKSNVITSYAPSNSNTYMTNLLWNSKLQKFTFGIFNSFESIDGINWTTTQYAKKFSSYCYIHMNYFPEIDKTIISSDSNYVHVPIVGKLSNLYMMGYKGEYNTLTSVIDLSIIGKKIIDVKCTLNDVIIYTDEEVNNVYVLGSNTYGIHGTGDRISKTEFTRLTYLNKKSYIHNDAVTSAPINFKTNLATSTVKYKPKSFNIGNNNVINFPDPLVRSISVEPVSTSTAVQNYSATLSVTAKNVVSGYLQLSPAGTTFQNHVSLDFDIEKGIEPVVFFKSSTDTSPLVIPSTNTSANDVYYTFVKSSGAVTLYTKHFSEAIVTQNSSLLSPQVHFNLPNLNTSITMSVSGDLLKLDIPLLEADAIAEYYVTASDMRNVFMFQSDSDDVDTITNGTDIKYFVRKNLWPSGLILNPCHAWVQSAQQIATTDKLGVIADNRELVKHDFVRHIAKSLFNTHLAVDLFTNENELKYDLAYKGHNTAWSNIWSSISGVSDASLNTTSYNGLYGQDASYGYYLTGDGSANTNICRQLLSQLTKSAPIRLQNLNTYVVDASKGYYSVPLVAGDSISFKLTLNTAANQHLLVNRPTAVPSRTYQIRINLRDSVSKGNSHADAVNVIVNDTAPVLYGGVSVTNSLNTSYPANY
jgi:hypothetical protein